MMILLSNPALRNKWGNNKSAVPIIPLIIAVSVKKLELILIKNLKRVNLIKNMDWLYI